MRLPLEGAYDAFMRAWCAVVLLIGCGGDATNVTRSGTSGPSPASGHSLGDRDGGTLDSDGPSSTFDLDSTHADAATDLAVRPTPDQCFMGWASFHGKCPAPIITRAGVTNDCDGTKGWEVIGANFEFARDNSAQHSADTGPEFWEDDPGVMRKIDDSWNVLTETRMCITSSQNGPGANQVFVINPDGNHSNEVMYQL